MRTTTDPVPDDGEYRHTTTVLRFWTSGAATFVPRVELTKDAGARSQDGFPGVGPLLPPEVADGPPAVVVGEPLEHPASTPKPTNAAIMISNLVLMDATVAATCAPINVTQYEASPASYGLVEPRQGF
jgi:hypothetical protein